MTNIGYARVSSSTQDLTIQREALQRAGCALVLEEKISGTSTDGRDMLKLALATLREGDSLVITRLDRLGRSLRDLTTIGDELQAKGIHLRVLDQQIDTGSVAGRLFFGILASVAEFETALRKERQREGIDRALSNRETRPDGTLKYAGTKPSISRDAVLELHHKGVGATDIARKLQIARASVYRLIKENAHDNA